MNKYANGMVALSVLAFFAGMSCVAKCQKPTGKTTHVATIPNAKNPQLLYYFVTQRELQDENYLKTIDDIAARGPFDFVFLTARGGADFYDYPKMKPLFTKLVAAAHARGIKVGLQLWSKEKELPADQQQSIVVESEAVLDPDGSSVFESASRGIRMSSGSAPHENYKATRSELLNVYAFKKTGEGEYTAGTLRDITDKTKAEQTAPGVVRISVHAGKDLAGYTVYAETAHYHAFPDMFSDFLPNSFSQALREYKSCGFDGSALDEFRYMTVGMPASHAFRERMFSPLMERAYRAQTGQDLRRSLFDMRYAPANDKAPRIAAINQYFDVLRKGVLAVENQFAKVSTEIQGPGTFHGIHDTFHNALENDEIWQTGINWWAIPRDYGQTDESTPMVTRVGIGLGHPKTVEYNQYYSKDLGKLEQEPIVDARYNVRMHYHAWNDMQGWGQDISQPQVLAPLTAIEKKVRLLNHFDAPRLDMHVLVVFGFPSLTNWVQATGVRNEWDINGNLHAEQKAVAVWNAGYRTALVPSYQIDSGAVTLDGRGGIVAGGHRFDSLIYLGPEYLDEANLTFLEKFVAQGGKLMLDGMATRDFTGKEIGPRFAKVAGRAVATVFDVTTLPKLGLIPNAIPNGALYEDGSVILTDLDSVLKDQPTPFEVTVGGHKFTGTYEGVLAIKVNAQGKLEKFAGGSITTVLEDGRPVLTSATPADLFVQGSTTGYQAITTGASDVVLH